MNKILSIVLVSAVFFSTSCKKELELAPFDTIIAGNAFRNVDDLEKGVLGVYSANNPINKIYIATLLTDEAKISDENRGQGQFTFKYQFSAGIGEHNSDYSLYYLLLDRANRILPIINAIPAITPAETAKKATLRAELLALRGIAHFELMIRFMPAGYDPAARAVAVMVTSDITAKPARNTVAQVVAQIETDLAAAKAEPTLQGAPTDVLRISKSAIAAYQARLAMLKRDWANAITFVTESINLSGKTLATSANFAAYWTDANESESILTYRNQSGPQLLWRDTNGDVFFEPSDELKNAYNRTADIRYNTYFGSVISGGQSDTSTINKYPGSALGPQINDLKIIRLAELFLNRAEARAENGDLIGAASDVNILRGVRIAGYVPVTFPTKDVAVAEILTERFKELCFEGFRFFDLKRKGLGITRNASDVTSPTWQNLEAGNFRFALPVPQDALFANPNNTQNPGY